MNILITGGTGFIGSHLANKLQKEGVDVTAGGLDPGRSAVPLKDGIETIRLDVTDPDTLDFDDYDVVVHLVALSPLRRPKGTTHHEVHVEGTRNVVKTVEHAGIEHLVHMSAVGADPRGPTQYIRAKGEAEQLVRESDVPHSIFRPSIIFGDGGEFLASIRDTASKLPVFPLPGGGKTKFQPLHVEDAAEALAEAAVSDADNEIYTVAGPDEYSMKELVELVYRSLDRKPRTLSIPMPLVFLGLAVAGALPFSPVGLDQYHALKQDATVEKNDIDKLGLEQEGLTALPAYLGLE